MSVALHLFQLFKGNFKTKTKMFLIWNNLLSGFEEFLYLVFSFYLVWDAFLWPSFLKKKKMVLVFFGPDIQTHLFISDHDSSFIHEGIHQNWFWQDWSRKFDHLIKKFFSTWPLFFLLWWRLLINNCHTQ